MPSVLEAVLYAVPVSTPAILIWAPLTTAPASSTTRPVTAAMETACANRAGEVPSAMNVISRLLTALTLLTVLLHITILHLGRNYISKPTAHAPHGYADARERWIRV